MEQFIYDISQGKYDSFEKLFSENISENNIVLMGEVIAATVLKHLIPYGDKCIEKMYRSLIKDIHRKNAPDYVLSEGYDVAQTDACFLWQYKGRKVSDIYGNNKFKKNITIKHACYNAASRYVEEIRGYHRNTEAMPDNDRHNMIATFDETKSDDYSKVDETIAKMKLTQGEAETLDCYMAGMAFVETAKWLSVNLSTIWRRRTSIQKKYLQLVVSD